MDLLFLKEIPPATAGEQSFLEDVWKMFARFRHQGTDSKQILDTLP